MTLRFSAPLPKFPESFRFGVATADHQCEAFDERYPDIRDVWDQTRGAQERGKATDFTRRYREDIDLARDAGCKIFRFSVAWARVEPEPGTFNGPALAHYQRVAEAIREAGMQPMVTLQHFVWPLHIEQRGGMISPDFPDWFATYAAAVAGALGRVDDWITLNEPNILCFGYIRPWWLREYAFHPGLPDKCGLKQQLQTVRRLIPNLFQAHRLGREAIHKINPKARVGANPAILGLPNWLQRVIDSIVTLSGTMDRFARGTRKEAASTMADIAQPRSVVRSMVGRFHQFVEPLITYVTVLSTSWWHLGQTGRLPDFLCPQRCIGAQDYVGFDYFWAIRTLSLARIKDLTHALTTGWYEHAPVWPEALYHILIRQSLLFPHLPIYILESGCVEVADGVERAGFYTMHIEQVQKAVAGGINVNTFIAWSITTNREWSSKFGPGSDFGLYHIDLDDDPLLTRKPTRALQVYKRIIADRGVS